jgi:hypothetical protein
MKNLSGFIDSMLHGTKRALWCLGLFALAACSQSEKIITSAGKYAGDDGRLSVNIGAPDSSHLSILVKWETVSRNGVHMTQTEGSAMPMPVRANQWMFYFRGNDELWFYDGGVLSCYKGTAAELSLAQSCSEANIADRAPEAVRQWIKSKTAL